MNMTIIIILFYGNIRHLKQPYAKSLKFEFSPQRKTDKIM